MAQIRAERLQVADRENDRERVPFSDVKVCKIFWYAYSISVQSCPANFDCTRVQFHTFFAVQNVAQTLLGVETSSCVLYNFSLDR